MLAEGLVLQNRYRVIKQLGQGGMGAVYEAIDERLDTTVALKETLFSDERLRRQFEREARLLARMHHPALPRVSDHFGEGDGQFLVMQYIAGDDLAQMMAHKRGPFPPDQVLTWGDQLLDALDYLHTQEPQIIHRDIKPQNLKLTARGQIILLDFGLAKGQTGEISRAPTTASIFGYTPNYAPLEQIQGLGTDPRSDIYALAATLYHLMTGVKPPDALSRAAALVNSQDDPLQPANTINSRVGPDIARVLARAMSQNRDQRFSSAAEMRAALKGSVEVATLTSKAEAATVLFNEPAATVLDKAAGTVKTPSLQKGETTVVRRPPRRRIAPWAMGAAAVLLVGIAFGAFYAYQQRKSSNSTPQISVADQNLLATPSPTVTSTPASAPATVQVAEETKPEPSGQVTTPNVTAKKPAREKAGEKTKPQANAEANADIGEDFQLLKVPEAPATPYVFQGPPAGGGRQQRRLGGGTTMRTLPDGTRVITSPDGTRVLTSPDGTQRVFRPLRRNRRRVSP
ncbi:MAG: protein kinase domain-containing protein [Pyrinomonadaceae bacterium]